MTELEARAESMARMYGEACSKKQAARLIHCSFGRIAAMLEDGRLKPACEGTRVDVRSIARYIAMPKQVEEEKRLESIKRRYGSGFAV